MSIDAFVSIHPGRIRNSKEVNEILSRIKRFEKKRKCEAGVVIIQNRQLGGIYEIVSKEEAEKLRDELIQKARSSRTGQGL